MLRCYRFDRFCGEIKSISPISIHFRFYQQSASFHPGKARSGTSFLKNEKLFKEKKTHLNV